MSKVTIELELKDIDHIAAIHTLARLLEIHESDEASDYSDSPSLMEILGPGDSFLRNGVFWDSFLPLGLETIMGTISFLITARGLDDQVLYQLLGGDEWDRAIRWLRRVSGDLDKLNTRVTDHYAEVNKA